MGLHQPLKLVEAPTFRPSLEEFKNPIQYIQSIFEIGVRFGLALITPPEGWAPEVHIPEVNETNRYPQNQKTLF